MTTKLTNLMKKAAEISMKQMSVVSESDHTVIFNTDCGATMDIKTSLGLTKLVLFQFPANAHASLILDKIIPFNSLFKSASSTGIEIRALAWSSRFEVGTAMDISKSGISSLELATGATMLLLPGYTHVDKGDPRPYSEAESIESLLTLRGRQMLQVLLRNPGERWTTQSLQKATDKLNGKEVSSSVAHRFICKLHNLELIAKAGTTGFSLTADGVKRITEALPEFLEGLVLPPPDPGTGSGFKNGESANSETVPAAPIGEPSFSEDDEELFNP